MLVKEDKGSLHLVDIFSVLVETKEYLWNTCRLQHQRWWPTVCLLINKLLIASIHSALILINMYHTYSCWTTSDIFQDAEYQPTCTVIPFCTYEYWLDEWYNSTLSTCSTNITKNWRLIPRCTFDIPNCTLYHSSANGHRLKNRQRGKHGSETYNRNATIYSHPPKKLADGEQLKRKGCFWYLIQYEELSNRWIEWRVHGAVIKLRDEGKSLLPIGMTAVEGDFSRGDVIAIRDACGLEMARGLANYASAEARLICRKSSSEFEKLLGYAAEPEMVHRDNLVLTR